MKIKALLLAAAMITAPAAMADDDGMDHCATDTIKRESNPILEIITIPFKMVFVLTYGPRCLIESIPKNPPKDESQ